MLRGLYTATAGMISQQRKHDTITNNVANMNTPGFKQNQTSLRSFPEMLISLVGGEPGQPTSKSIGRMNTGVFAEENVPVFMQGDLNESGNPFDFALISNIQVDGIQFDGSGKGVSADGQIVFQPQSFFSVQNANGEERYTRNGKFTVNQQGELITGEGYLVLDANRQPIQLIDPNTQAGETKIRVNENGQLFNEVNGQAVQDAAGNPQTLLISIVDNPGLLVREGNGTYRLTEGQARTATQQDQVLVRQGYFERSNVDPSQSMVDMMSASRAYEANQKVIQAYDKSLQLAANEIGKV
ncbi:flagellar hook-basal body protein [Paenibacillus sp. y28]|uniref:flagellar hook-basal body protein n=1 Tax=Paenibacillus sp. y28 TaxID=3129110 RepID=UPI00301A0AA2